MPPAQGTWQQYQQVPRIALEAVELPKLDSNEYLDLLDDLKAWNFQPEAGSSTFEIVPGNGPDPLESATSLLKRHHCWFLLALPGGHLPIAHVLIDGLDIKSVQMKQYCCWGHQAQQNVAQKEVVVFAGHYSPARRMGSFKLFRMDIAHFSVGDYVRGGSNGEDHP